MFTIEGILLNMGDDMDEDQVIQLFSQFLDDNNFNFMGSIEPYSSEYSEYFGYDEDLDYGLEVEDIRELTKAESELYEKLVDLQEKTDQWLYYMEQCNNNCSHDCQNCVHNSVCDKKTENL